MCPFSEFSKILVGNGYEETSFEVIDLSSLSSECAIHISSPLGFTSGGLNYQNIPIICGANFFFSTYKPLTDCFKYEEGNWKPFFGFNFPRSGAAMSMSALGEFFISGGNDGIGIQTSEVLTENGWRVVKGLMPVHIKTHCITYLNLTTVLLIGGLHNGSPYSSSTTYYYNTIEEVWSEGPPITERRIFHMCGRIATDKDSKEYTGITVGGLGLSSGIILKAVEILDDGYWRPGPDFPVEITLAALVEIPNGGILIVGGQLNGEEKYDTIFKLDHGGKSAKWTELPQKLSKANSKLTAFLIPDNLANCTEISNGKI